MKLLKKDFRQGNVKVQLETLDDLWYLSTIVEPQDSVSGSTIRKIKIGKGEERKQQITTRKVYITITVEKVEFHESTGHLRILGIIKAGPDDIPLGLHHSFDLEPGDSITVHKTEWLRYQKDKLIEASKSAAPKILMVVFDREQAYFALLKKYGYQLLSEISGDVMKKAEISAGEKKKARSFYGEIIEQLKSYIDRYKIEHVIAASPAFWKDEFMKSLKDEALKKKVITATCSSVTKTSFDEVLKRTETQAVLKQDRTSKELSFVEQLLSEISKDGLAAYGMKETKVAVESGAVKTLLVSDKLIKDYRSNDKFKELDSIMKLADKNQADVIIISSDNDAGRKLDGLSGIAAILRFKMSY